MGVLKRKNWEYILGSLVLCILWGLVLPMYKPRIKVGAVAQTRWRIFKCYMALSALSDQEKKGFLSALRGCKNPLEMNRLLVEYIGRSPFVEDYSVRALNRMFGVQRGIIVDAWGQPLRLAVRGGYLSLDVFADEDVCSSELIIWSCGPNGWDEWGHGDDVVVVGPGFKSVVVDSI